MSPTLPFTNVTPKGRWGRMAEPLLFLNPPHQKKDGADSYPVKPGRISALLRDPLG